MRSRFRPSAAMVVACIALFVALGGGAYALSGSNTVQSDDLGPGAQVKAPDVADNAVNGADVVNNSLGGADVNEATLTGDAQKIDYNAPATGGGNRTTIGKFGPYTLKAECLATSAVNLLIYANGPAGTADSMWGTTRNDAVEVGVFSNGQLIPANTDTQILSVSDATGYKRIGGRSILRSGPALVQIDFEGTADATGSGNCFIYGTAMKAT